MAGLAGDNPFVRMVDAVRTADSGTGLDKLALQALGGIDAKEHARANPLLRAIGDETRIMQLTMPGTPEHTDAQRRIQALRIGGETAKKELATIATKLGLGGPSDLSEQAIRIKVTDKDEADRIHRSVVALNESIAVGGIDSYSKQLGMTAPKQPTPPKGKRDTWDVVGLGKELLQSHPLVENARILGETPIGRVGQSIIGDAFTPRSDPSRDQTSILPAKALAESDTSRDKKLTIAGTLTMQNMKEVLLAGSGSSGDLFTGGSMAGTI
jgi:hypothetical protein